MDDITAMRRAVYDLQLWLHQRQLDPVLCIGALTAVLSEYAVAHDYSLKTIVEQILICSADLREATKGDGGKVAA